MRPDFLDVRQLEALKAVIDSGSITRAAEQIGKSQSAVTRLIQDLETELGFSVLKRNGPRVTPTENGLNLYQEAEHFLIGLAAVSRGARLVSLIDNHPLSIATISSLATSIVPDTMADVMKAAPQTTLSLDVDTSEMVTKAVLDQKADIGIIGFAPDTPGIQFQWIAEVPFVALVRADDPLAQKSQLDYEDFRERHLIAVSGRYRLRLLFERALSETDVKPSSIIIANASYVSTSLAVMPNSIALVQSAAYLNDSMAHLKAIPLGFYLPFHFGVISAVGKPMTPTEALAIERLEYHASQLPGYRKCDSFPEFGQPL